MAGMDEIFFIFRPNDRGVNCNCVGGDQQIVDDPFAGRLLIRSGLRRNQHRLDNPGSHFDFAEQVIDCV